MVVWLLILKYWRAGVAVVLVAAVVGYVVTLQRQIGALTAALNAQKTENAQMRQAMQQLAFAVAAMKPGDPPKIIYVPKPEYITLPGKEIPVVVTRTEHTIETRTETLTLPGKEIERIIREAPQSILVGLTATRDIAKGETFRVVVSQIQPGVWGGILDLGSPVTAEVTTVTPIDRIPAPIPAPSRWTTALLLGPDAFHPRGATVLTRAEVEYRISPRLFTRGEVSWHWNGAGASGLLLLGARF